jgi:hypothetical protein
MDKKYDLVIAGGGPAGINAAIAAGRLGVSTLLIERYGFLGGMSTAAMVYPWMTFHNQYGEQVIKGIADEIVSRLVSIGASPGHLRDTIGFVYSLTPYKEEEYKLLIFEMLEEAGGDLLLHSMVEAVEMLDGKISSLSVRGKSGSQTITGSVFIDCTGDGDLAYLSGAPMQFGRKHDQLTQPMTMKFRMKGVNLERVKDYMLNQRDQFYSHTLFEDIEKGLPLTGVSGFYKIWEEAGLPINRDQILFFAGPGPDEALINCSRVQGYKGTDSWDLTQAEKEGRSQVSLLAEFMKDKVPGFEKAELASVGIQIGVRETRRIDGEYILTANDVKSGRKFTDVIAKSAYPIDIHDPVKKDITVASVGGDGAFDIPYRSLLPKNVDNLLAAGRCISTTHEAFATTRLTPSAMATGQAAGTAAALALRQQTLPKNLNIEELQKQLILDGVFLG